MKRKHTRATLILSITIFAIALFLVWRIAPVNADTYCDGYLVSYNHGGDAAGTYLTRADGSSEFAVLGFDGRATDVSPDGRWVLTSALSAIDVGEPGPPDYDYYSNIYRTRPNGIHEDLLTDASPNDEYKKFYDNGVYNSDGQKIAYTFGLDQDRNEIYVMRANGPEKTGITTAFEHDDAPNYSNLSFSPSGLVILAQANGLHLSDQPSNIVPAP
jgi:Tol biopolymer transport system component